VQKKVLIILSALSITVSVLIITTIVDMNPLFSLDPIAKAERIAMADSNVKNLIDGNKYAISVSGWSSNTKVNPFMSYPEITIFLTNNTDIEVVVDLLNDKVMKVDKSTSVVLHQ
jgi:hypothetical protein